MVHTHSLNMDFLEDIVELVSGISVLGVVGNSWIGRDESVLGSDVQRVVNLPVDISDLASRMEQALKVNNKLVKFIKTQTQF